MDLFEEFYLDNFGLVRAEAVKRNPWGREACLGDLHLFSRDFIERMAAESGLNSVGNGLVRPPAGDGGFFIRMYENVPILADPPTDAEILDRLKERHERSIE